MSAYFTTKQASDISGASRQVIRVYTQRYARYLSTEATPEPGMGRKFTAADLRLLAFIYQRTAAGETHEQVLDRLAAGELEHFEWQPPEPEPEPQSAADSASGALVPLERLHAAQVIMQDAQRREAAALEQVATLTEQVRQLERELGKAQGELSGVKGSRYKAPSWWRAIFGGRSEE